jgi:hypothetical protein
MPTPASESAVRAEPVRDEALSPAELSAAIEKFSELDWLRVKKAALRFYGRCGGDWEILQNEAMARALDGRRKCRKGVGAVTFLGNVIRSIASERDGLDFERNVSWTDPAKQIRDKIARMDDLFMDDLLSMTDDELLQEATEQGIDVAAVGRAGRAAFERAPVLVGGRRLALVGQVMADGEETARRLFKGIVDGRKLLLGREDPGKPAPAYDRAKAASRLGPILPANLRFYLIEVAVICSDAVLILTASVLTGVLYHFAFLDSVGTMTAFVSVGTLTFVIFSAILTARANYRLEALTNFWKQVRETTATWLFVFFVLLAVAFSFKVSEEYSRGAILAFFAVGWAAIIAWRLAVAHLIVHALAPENVAHFFDSWIVRIGTAWTAEQQRAPYGVTKLSLVGQDIAAKS